jgi:hypothetical protein
MRGVRGVYQKANPRTNNKRKITMIETITGVISPQPDNVNHPPHYKSHPSGIECIQVTEHMGFCLGNAIKYIWRADEKVNAIEDLEKARWYIEREIERRRQEQPIIKQS